MATFTFRRLSTNETTEVRAATFADASRKYQNIRLADLNAEHKGVKAVNTIRSVEAADGAYEHVESGFRFNLLVKFFTPTKPVDRVAVADERGEAAMRRGSGHY